MRKKVILGLGAMALIFAAYLPSLGATVICPDGSEYRCYADREEGGFYKGKGDTIIIL